MADDVADREAGPLALTTVKDEVLGSVSGGRKAAASDGD